MAAKKKEDKPVEVKTETPKAEEPKKPEEKPVETAPAPEVKSEEKPAETAPPPEAKPEEKPTEAPKEEAKPEEQKPTEAKPEEAPTTEPPKEEAVPEPPETPKKTIFPFLGKGKKAPKAEPKIVKKEPQVTETPVYSNPAEIAKALDEQILQAKKGDYWVIRIKKQTLLIFMGVLILTMWLIPLIQKIDLSKIKPPTLPALPKINISLPFLNKNNTQATTPETSATPEPSPQTTGTAKIRVRYLPGNEAAAQQVSEALKQSGFTTIDLAEDKQLNDVGNSVVVKKEGIEMRTKLQTLFVDTYRLATSSAELAADSDFDALILLGKSK